MNKSARMFDFLVFISLLYAFAQQELEVIGPPEVVRAVAGGRHKSWRSMIQEKGQLEELVAMAESLLRGNPWPISLE